MSKIRIKTFNLSVVITSLSILLLTYCSCNISNPVTITSTKTTTTATTATRTTSITATTTTINNKFEVLECPDEAYIGDFITIKARVANYSATIDYELSLEQAVEGATNVNRVLYSGNCEADNKNIVLWYFQIPLKAYAGIANISIVADEGIGEVFNHNIIIRE